MSYGSGGCLAVANAVANHVVNNVTATNATSMYGWGGFAHFNALDMDIHHTTVSLPAGDGNGMAGVDDAKGGVGKGGCRFSLFLHPSWVIGIPPFSCHCR